MFTPGNKKLGGRLVWGFGLPSGRSDLCVGLSQECQTHCYARQIEELRPMVLARYERNLQLSRRRDFPQRVIAFLLAHEVGVVRIHTGGDFYGVEYARQWLRIIRRLRKVRFFFYTRSWRDPAIRPEVEQLAALSNCRGWFSCDRGTGVPDNVPAQVRLAWLMIAPDDLVPPNVDLVFRVRCLRRLLLTRVSGVRICPAEDGVKRQRPVTCDVCHLCWRPLPEPPPTRVSLPVVSSDRPP